MNTERFLIGLIMIGLVFTPAEFHTIALSIIAAYFIVTSFIKK